MPKLRDVAGLAMAQRSHQLMDGHVVLSERPPSGVVDLRAHRLDGFGIDRLSLSFPLRGEPDPAIFENRSARLAPVVVDEVSGSVEQREHLTYGVNVPLTTKRPTMPVGGDPTRQQIKRPEVTSGVFVGAAQVGGGWWGKVESNPARFDDPDGCSLLRLDRLDEAAERMWSVVEQLDLGSSVDLEGAKVKRVDLARDFRDVRSPSGYVWGLLNIKRPYAKRQYVYSDPQRRNAQTLWAGSGAGGVRLYDQNEAYADKGAPRGSLRWEVEARGDWLARALKSQSITYGRLSVSRLVELAETRWEWSGMGIEVTSANDVVSKVKALVDVGGYPDDDGEWVKVTPALARGFLGQLLLGAQGLDLASAKATQSQHHKLQRYLGVTITPQLFAEFDSAPVGRLDWCTGQEIAA